VLREELAERWIETLPRHGYRFVGPVVAHQRNSARAKDALANAAAETRNNLPVELTSFIGRAAALGEVKGLLASQPLDGRTPSRMGARCQREYHSRAECDSRPRCLADVTRGGACHDTQAGCSLLL
jgi:hypothetical protein